MCHSRFRLSFRSLLRGISVIGIVLVAFASSACIIARHPAGIAPSTSPLLSSSYTILGPVEASSCKWVVLMLPVSGKSSTDKIVEELIQEKGATALIGVTVEQKTTLYPLILMGSDCSIVKGTAVKVVAS